MRTLPLIVFALAAQFAALSQAQTAARPDTKPASPPAQPEPEKQVATTPPPGPMAAEDKALLARAKEALDSKKDPAAILADPAFMPLHARTEFRELIKAHAKVHTQASPLTLVTPAEPGTKLQVTFEFQDTSGKPIAGALLYLYHTSAKGWYSDKAAHIQANSGDFRHARLFGYALTDEKGRIEVKTIRPASYPNTDLPQHIHMHLSIGGKEVLVSELLFEDDPMLSRQELEEAERGGYVATKPEKAADGSQKCKGVFTVK